MEIPIDMPQHLCTFCLFSCSQVLAASPLKGDTTDLRGDRISPIIHYPKFRLVVMNPCSDPPPPLSLSSRRNIIDVSLLKYVAPSIESYFLSFHILPNDS